MRRSRESSKRVGGRVLGARRAVCAGLAVLACVAASCWSSPAAAATFVPAFPPLRLVGRAGGGSGGRTAGPLLPGGAYIGGDAGAGWGAREPGDLAPAVGAHVGYQFPSGLALDFRADDQGGIPDAKAGALAAAGGGIAYYAPISILRPFADVHVGVASYDAQVKVSDEVGAGLSLLVSDDVSIDAAFRDWILVDGNIVKLLPSVTLGVDVGFFG